MVGNIYILHITKTAEKTKKKKQKQKQKIEQVLSTTQILCITLKTILAQAIAHQRNKEQPNGEKISCPRKLPHPSKNNGPPLYRGAGAFILRAHH